jgi:hypothetical protein
MKEPLVWMTSVDGIRYEGDRPFRVYSSPLQSSDSTLIVFGVAASWVNFTPVVNPRSTRTFLEEIGKVIFSCDTRTV